MALSLLPPANIPAYFDALKDKAMTDPSILLANRRPVESVFNYFEKTYIGVKNANGIRGAPTFQMETWSIYERIMAHHQIGNSTVEGFNSKLKNVPAHSSAQKVASILAENDRTYKTNHEFARSQNLRIDQAFRKSPQTATTENNRYLAVRNGAHGQTPFDHLKQLINHIHTPF
ncbi:hypothetical protein PENTCL1PPCAC_4345 [Pristionchus entomophagus]|uniref:Transposase IS204/IS1001/IS1096/IS1165 DDE domain-containing protein n=1 Tax=Pristionchus entomophagus TaxID=358040 RepID=A0AAV5SQ22_9BILA|nr:hypothetical protein PENTCL1PPCAC_4345 [Pristionchus entomophagus]